MALTREELLRQFGALAKQQEQKKVMPQVSNPVVTPVIERAKKALEDTRSYTERKEDRTPGAFVSGINLGADTMFGANRLDLGAVERQRIAQLQAEKPKTFQAGQATGAILSSLLPVGGAEALAGKTLARVAPKLTGLGLNVVRGGLSGTGVTLASDIAQGKSAQETAKDVGYGLAFGAVADTGLSYLGKAIKNIRAGQKTADAVAEIARTAPETKVSIEKELGLPEGSTWEDIQRKLDEEDAVEALYQKYETIEAPKQPVIKTAPDKYGIVKGEKQVLYHGSNNEFDAIKPGKAQAGEGVFLTTNPDTAKNYGKNLYEIEVNPQKIAYDSDLIKAKNEIVNEMQLKIDELDELLDSGEISSREHEKRFKEIQREISTIEDDSISTGNVIATNKLKEQGYDVLVSDMQSGEQGAEVLVLNENAITGTNKSGTIKPADEKQTLKEFSLEPNIERELFPSTVRQPSPTQKMPEPAIITAQKRAQEALRPVVPELPKNATQANVTPSANIPERWSALDVNKPQTAMLELDVTAPKVKKTEPSLKVASVLTEPVKSKGIPLKEQVESVYQSFVSTGRPLERIGGNVKYISSAIRKTAGSVDYALGKKMIDKEGNEIGNSLIDIVGDVPKQQKEDLFTYAFHKHNIARMAQDKPVFGDTVTPDVSAQAMAEIEARNPGIAEKATELNQYINNLMDGWAVKSGLVDEQTLAKMREMYPDYVPTYRDRSELAKSMYGTKGSGLNVIKKATGSSRDLLPLDQQIAEMTNRVIRSSRKNEMYNAMHEMADVDPDKMGRFFKIISKEKQNIDDGIESTLETFDEPIKKVGDSYVLNYFRDGEKVQAEISKDMYEALRSIGDMTDEQKVAQVIRKYGTNPFKSLITQYNPLFALSNVMRDFPTAFVYSHNGVEWAKNVPTAFKEIVSNGQYWKEYQALGGTRSGIFTAEKGVKPLFKGEGNKLKETAGKALEGVEWFNNITETLPRFAEYLATVKKGGNTYDNKLLGMMRASEITTDFTRSGRATKFADAFVPYLNPSVQGIDKFFRQVATKPAQTAAKAGAVMTVPTVILDQINKGNQEYKEISPREKNGFYLVPDGEGKFYRIPKSRETGVVFSTMFEWMARRARGEQVTAKEMIDNVKENFSPVSVVDSTLFTPLYKTIKQIKEPQSEVRNFAGIPIEPLSLKRYAPGERYDQYTSEVAKAIGAQFDISPKAIDYLLRSYSGIVGQVLLPKTSQKGKPGLAGTFESKFKSDPVFKSENQNKLYSALEKVQQEANSLDRQKGYTTSQDRKITTEPEKLASALNKVSKELADYRKRQKEIDADASIDERKKQEMIRSIQKVMNDKAKEALQKQGLWKE